MNSSSISSAVPTIKCEDTSPSPTAAVGTDGESGAYLSVNVNLSATMMNFLAAEGGGTTTLRTPEIVNDVITMTNPLDQYHYDKNSSLKVNNLKCNYIIYTHICNYILLHASLLSILRIDICYSRYINRSQTNYCKLYNKSLLATLKYCFLNLHHCQTLDQSN